MERPIVLLRKKTRATRMWRSGIECNGLVDIRSTEFVRYNHHN
jgi:hypothetical protein